MSTETEELIAPPTNGYGADSIQVLEGLEAVRNVPQCTLAMLVLKACIIWYMK